MTLGWQQSSTLRVNNNVYSDIPVNKRQLTALRLELALEARLGILHPLQDLVFFVKVFDLNRSKLA